MESLSSTILTIGSVLLAIPVITFSIEVLASITLSRRISASESAYPKRDEHVAILVPAHNESNGLIPTLNDIKNQLRAGDRLLVVADNCTDDTATVAAACGADVVERHDLMRQGKGYALDFGLRHLGAAAPDFVIVVDADCRLSADAIDQLTAVCAATNRPAQALDLMTAPANAQVNQRVAEFAWRVKNWLRPLGLKTLGLPCQLMGTGMAFPWKLIRSADLATGLIVEDVKLGLDLAMHGHPADFCPSARVTSQFASSAKAAETQRQRWERGHIAMIFTTLPWFLVKAVTRGNWRLLALVLDLAVPPLSLLAMMVLAMFSVTALGVLLGMATFPLFLSALTLALFLLVSVLAWVKCGRDLLPTGAIPMIARYAFGKLGLYRDLLLKKAQGQWVRTDRTKSD